MRNLFFFITFLIAQSVYCQQHIISLNLFSSNNGVVIKFTIAAGTYCDGFSILRSIDSLNYYPVGQDYTARCLGQGTEERTYTDAGAVENQYNYYQVKLEPSVEVSSPRSIYYTKGKNVNLLPYPNPVYSLNDPLTLKVLNVNNARLQGYLYNQFGHPLRFLDITTKASLTTLDTGDLQNGLYVIWLTDGRQVYSCKFIIKR
jgi:hypothetical protein